MIQGRLNSTSKPQLDPSCVSKHDSAEQIAYEMAYGLSHELNNPLANIAGRARLLAEQESDPEKRQQLAIIVDQAMRGCEMIADLMLFARPPAWRPAPMNLQQVLVELCERAHTVCGSRGLALQVQCEASPLPVIQADEAALREAFWAVLRNAIDAAQTNVGVELVVNAEHCVVSIRDDGAGLSQRALECAFHPFFSGREAGRGIGLGLSKARRIVMQCGGTLELNNEQPGCQATISLPRSPA